MLELLQTPQVKKVVPEFHWKLENNLQNQDAGNNMMVTGSGPNFSTVAGKQAIHLTDLGGLITDKEITLGTQGWTYSTELYLNNNNSYGHLFTSSPDQVGFAIKICKSGVATIPAGSVYFYASQTGSRVSKLIVPLQKWVKLQVVYEPGTLKFYLDDNLVDTLTQTLSANTGASRKYLLGRYQQSTLNEGGDFYIRDLKVFLRALKQDELKNI